MRTAKELFRASPHFAGFQKLLTDPAFEPAVKAALTAYVESLPAGALDPSRSWDSWLRVTGAREVLDVLSTLHTPDEAPHAPSRPTLHYDRPNLKG
jgi:hypothetical protein